MKKRYLALIIVSLLILFGCAQPMPSLPPAAPVPKPPPLEEGKQIINIEVDDQTLHYQRHSFWSEEKFSQILESRQEFETEQIDLYQFKQSKEELNYEGEVNGVPTTIRLIFPYTIAHCHEHVWPAK